MECDFCMENNGDFVRNHIKFEKLNGIARILLDSCWKSLNIYHTAKNGEFFTL